MPNRGALTEAAKRTDLLPLVGSSVGPRPVLSVPKEEVLFGVRMIEVTLLEDVLDRGSESETLAVGEMRCCLDCKASSCWANSCCSLLASCNRAFHSVNTGDCRTVGATAAVDGVLNGVVVVVEIGFP